MSNFNMSLALRISKITTEVGERIDLGASPLIILTRNILTLIISSSMTWVLEAEHRSSSGKSRETSYDYFYGLRK